LIGSWLCVGVASSESVPAAASFFDFRGNETRSFIASSLLGQLSFSFACLPELLRAKLGVHLLATAALRTLARPPESGRWLFEKIMRKQ
jgi:hypothetical protein